MKQVLLPDERWQLVAKGYKFTEGTAVNAKGEVFFNDVPDSKTYKIGLEGKVSVFLTDTKNGDGQAFGPDGRLHAVAGGANQILAYDTEGKSKVIAEGFRGNDLVVRHDGGIYVTHPAWNGMDPSKIWYVSPKGDKRVVDTGLKFSNGITLSPDQTLLYVADSRSHWVQKTRMGRGRPRSTGNSGAPSHKSGGATIMSSRYFTMWTWSSRSANGSIGEAKAR
jgi:sugar lactone lactonase YvrE